MNINRVIINKNNELVFYPVPCWIYIGYGGEYNASGLNMHNVTTMKKALEIAQEGDTIYICKKY
jgi:hypothetical protein